MTSWIIHRLEYRLVQQKFLFPHFDNAISRAGEHKALAGLTDADVSDDVMMAGRWQVVTFLRSLVTGVPVRAVRFLHHFCALCKSYASFRL